MVYHIKMADNKEKTQNIAKGPGEKVAGKLTKIVLKILYQIIKCFF